MKGSTRKEKLLALQAAVQGNLNALRHYRQQKLKDIFFMVVCDNGTPKPTDLVDVRLADKQGQKRMPYAEFLKNSVAHGSFCITVD